MTDQSGSSVWTPGERALADAYRVVEPFARARARGGDRSAALLHEALTQMGHPYPTRAMIRSWLANCGSERYLFGQHPESWDAVRILAAMDAAEARAPGSTDAIWHAVVDETRAPARAAEGLPGLPPPGSRT